MPPLDIIFSDLAPCLGDAIARGEPIYTLPPICRKPHVTYSPEAFRALGEERDWGHALLRLEPLHAKGFKGAGVVVAIVDTGISVSHPDLASRIVPVGNKDFTGGPNGFLDGQGHGTHCAGITAADANGQGLIGAAPEARLMAVKGLDDRGSGASSWLAAGVKHAADNGADILSCSWGSGQRDATIAAAIRYAVAKGCWVVVAAGNDGRAAPSFPAQEKEPVAVAAVDKNGLRASFSTISAENDCAAPGVNILSTLPDGRYGTMSGTSMATPYVSGCLALVRGAIKAAGVKMPSQEELLKAILLTSRDIAPPGRDADTGAGLIDPAALIAYFVKDTPGKPEEPSEPTEPPGGGMDRETLKKILLRASDALSLVAKLTSNTWDDELAKLPAIIASQDWLLDLLLKYMSKGHSLSAAMRMAMTAPEAKSVFGM